MNEEQKVPYRLKCQLQSDDGGKTWWIRNIHYVTKGIFLGDDYATDFDFTDDHNFDVMVLQRIDDERDEK